MKKVLSIFTAVCLIAVIFAGCREKPAPKPTGEENGKAAVRFLNFKPEVAKVYEEIAKAYKNETGNTLTVETAASGNYEQTLTAKMGTKETPTLFQINGPKGYANWKDYCADLSDTELYRHLTDKSLAVTSEGRVYGIPYVVEGYGIIYNKEITDKYFALPNKAAEYSSMDDVRSFNALKAVAEDMQRNASALGIKGVFASTSLKTGEDWRWQTHLANVPIYYEFSKNNTDLTGNATNKISFEYGDRFKSLFDLYLNNSTTDRKVLGSKIVDESMAEFALGQCAMVQNGNWAWGQISNVTGNKVKAENIKFLPLYMGFDGEENQGLCIGTENFFAVNAKASEAEQKAAEDFMYWLFSSDTGKNFVINRLEMIAPFDTFNENEKPKDPLAQEVIRWMDKDDIKTIPWNFTVFPGQTFKNDFGAALLQYAQGTKSWDEVKRLVVDRWEAESK